MKKLLAILLLCTPLISQYIAAATPPPPEEEHKEGIDYFAFNTMLMDVRSLGSFMASEVVAGTYLTDYVTVETRGGWGWNEDDAAPGLTIGIKYWFSWYMGVNYSLTDFFEVYGKYGFSHVQGTTSRDDPISYKETPEELLSSTFSISWVIGGDFKVTDTWYISTEVGRLHSDTTTDLETVHYGAGIKYKF